MVNFAYKFLNIVAELKTRTSNWVPLASGGKKNATTEQTVASSNYHCKDLNHENTYENILTEFTLNTL